MQEYRQRPTLDPSCWDSLKLLPVLDRALVAHSTLLNLRSSFLIQELRNCGLQTFANTNRTPGRASLFIVGNARRSARIALARARIWAHRTTGSPSYSPIGHFVPTGIVNFSHVSDALCSIGRFFFLQCRPHPGRTRRRRFILPGKKRLDRPQETSLHLLAHIYTAAETSANAPKALMASGNPPCYS